MKKRKRAFALQKKEIEAIENYLDNKKKRDYLKKIISEKIGFNLSEYFDEYNFFSLVTERDEERFIKKKKALKEKSLFIETIHFFGVSHYTVDIVFEKTAKESLEKNFAFFQETYSYLLKELVRTRAKRREDEKLAEEYFSFAFKYHPFSSSKKMEWLERAFRKAPIGTEISVSSLKKIILLLTEEE